MSLYERVFHLDCCWVDCTVTDPCRYEGDGTATTKALKSAGKASRALGDMRMFAFTLHAA
jgi:hypothetical protein